MLLQQQLVRLLLLHLSGLLIMASQFPLRRRLLLHHLRRHRISPRLQRSPLVTIGSRISSSSSKESGTIATGFKQFATNRIGS